MERNELLIAEIKRVGILPLYYHDDMVVCVNIAKALYKAGIRSIEFTNRGKQALKNFEFLVAERNSNMPELKLGVGTIKSGAEVNIFTNAGADFLVSPFFDVDISDAAYLNKMLWIPGCMTPKEIHTAHQAGYELIKLFPGDVLGADYVKAILPLFPGLSFMVTGGVDATEKNLKTWFNAGVAAVGMGSKLITADIVKYKNFTTLEINVKEAMRLVQEIRAVK